MDDYFRRPADMASLTLDSFPALPAVTLRHVHTSYDILVADDNAVLRGLLTSRLEQRGYRVLQAECPVSAYELLDIHGLPRLLVTDVDFGTEAPSGHELARRAVGLSRHLHVLRMSGDDVAGDFSHPRVRNLSKPFDMGQFLQAVHPYVPAQLPLFDYR